MAQLIANTTTLATALGQRAGELKAMTRSKKKEQPQHYPMTPSSMWHEGNWSPRNANQGQTLALGAASISTPIRISNTTLTLTPIAVTASKSTEGSQVPQPRMTIPPGLGFVRSDNTAGDEAPSSESQSTTNANPAKPSLSTSENKS